MTTPIIVCLGGGLIRRDALQEPRAWIGAATKLRVDAAATLWRRQGGILVFSGGPVDSHGPSEAEAMRDYSMHNPWNIPDNAIVTEGTSIDTAENIRNVIALLQRSNLNTGSVVLISGTKNIRRATAYFRAYNSAVTAMTPSQVLAGADDADEHVTPKDRFQEWILRQMQRIDRQGRLATWCAKIVRQCNRAP